MNRTSKITEWAAPHMAEMNAATAAPQSLRSSGPKAAYMEGLGPGRA